MIFNVGNIFLGIGALIGTILVVYGLFIGFRQCKPCRKKASEHNHIIQLFLCFMFFIGLLWSAFIAFGPSMAQYLLTGVGIAIGLALQPIFKKMVAGIVFDTTIHTGCNIKCGKYEGIVHEVGIVHTWIDSTEGMVCIHNEYFDSNPIVIIKQGVGNADKKEPPELRVLKYW